MGSQPDSTMYTVLVLKSLVWFQWMVEKYVFSLSIVKVNKLALEEWIAKDQDPTLHLQHTLKILLCHQGSWAQFCRTHISFSCKDSQSNVLFYCFYRSYTLRSVLGKLPFMSEQGRAVMFQGSLLSCREGRYTEQSLFQLCWGAPGQTGMLVSSINSIICVQVEETRNGAVQVSLAMPTN